MVVGAAFTRKSNSNVGGKGTNADAWKTYWQRPHESVHLFSMPVIVDAGGSQAVMP